ncbi:MAG: hypothetical protein NWS87_02400 [Sediminibacterium sp.]|jgi:hypothetical protein|nr:hypothetical protein [Sediminibacterium sp.]
MQKLLSKLDLILVFRLIMTGVVALVGYQNSDNVAMLFALFFAIYSIVGAKYKIGCGYNNCGYTPSSSAKHKTNEIDFTEIK